MDYIEKLQTTCINEMRVNLCYLICSQVSHMEISDVYCATLVFTTEYVAPVLLLLLSRFSHVQLCATP